MALNVTSQKKKPAPRRNPEPEGGLIDGALVKDVGPAVAVGFAHAHLEQNMLKFKWWADMSTAKRLLVLVIGGVYFRRQGKAALSYGLFGLAGVYVQRYLAERQSAAPAVQPAAQQIAPPTGQQASLLPQPAQATMVNEEMKTAMGGLGALGALTSYYTAAEAGPGFDPASLTGPGGDLEFAIG